MGHQDDRREGLPLEIRAARMVIRVLTLVFLALFGSSLALVADVAAQAPKPLTEWIAEARASPLHGVKGGLAVLPTKGTGLVRAAMAEARRSPFYNATGEGLVMGQLAGVPVPYAGDRPAPDSARGPSFRRIFLPTIGGVLLSELAFVLGVRHCDSDSGGGATAAGCLTSLLMGTAALILGPPTVARIAGGSFGKGVLGSVAGIGLGWALFRLGTGFGLVDDSVAYWVFPAAQALLTTVLAIR